MRIIVDHIANGLFFLLGVAHTVLTLIYQRPFDLDALMYTGAGLAFVFLSFFNFARVRTSDRVTKWLSVLCNVLTTFYLLLIAAVFADPRVVVAIVALLLLVVLSVIDVRQA